MVGGTELPLTVYPFILRGVTLAGIDSGWCLMPRRREIWQHLAGDWKLPNLSALATKVSLKDLEPEIQSMLKGQHAGRTVVVPERL